MEEERVEVTTVTTTTVNHGGPGGPGGNYESSSYESESENDLKKPQGG